MILSRSCLLGALALPGFAVAGPALAANGIAKVQAEYIEPESGLRARTGARYYLGVTLKEGVDVRNCPDGQGVGVKLISLQVVAPNRMPAAKSEFYPGEFIQANDPCGATELKAPLMFPFDEELMVTVQLSTGEILSVNQALKAPAGQKDLAIRTVESDVSLLYGGADGKLGVGWNLNADLTALSSVPVFASFDVARVSFTGESSAAKGTTDFKEAMKLETSFIRRFGPVDQYYAFIVTPFALESDDDTRNINYKGAVAFAFEVPGTVALERRIQRLLGGCDQGPGVNCTAWGLIGEVAYSANTKIKRNNGRVDWSNDYVTTAEARWDFPLTERVRFLSSYKWQSDSPDGSSSEASEFGFSYRPLCEDALGFKLSWINGEFMPGDQKKDAVRFGVERLLGGAPAGC